MVCNYQYPNNRTDFKLLAASCHLERLKKIKNIAGGVGHFRTQVAVDGLLTEVIGAKDSLLHEVNKELKLGLSGRDVTDLVKIQKTLKKKGLNTSNILQDPLWIRKKGHWLWQLNNYRNFSIHEDIIQRQIEVGQPHVVRFRFNDPNNATSGLGPEIISYFDDCLNKMKQMVTSVRKKVRQLQSKSKRP